MNTYTPKIFVSKTYSSGTSTGGRSSVGSSRPAPFVSPAESWMTPCVIGWARPHWTKGQ